MSYNCVLFGGCFPPPYECCLKRKQQLLIILGKNGLPCCGTMLSGIWFSWWKLYHTVYFHFRFLLFCSIVFFSLCCLDPISLNQTRHEFCLVVVRQTPLSRAMALPLSMHLEPPNWYIIFAPFSVMPTWFWGHAEVSDGTADIRWDYCLYWI